MLKRVGVTFSNRNKLEPYLNGLQLLNVALGGTLDQHVGTHRHPGVADAHTIEVHPDSELACIIGPGTHLVNSRHHQAADIIAPGLRVSARSPDGCVEALESPD